jgi:hypothetical protein
LSKYVYRPDLGITIANPGPTTHYRPQIDILVASAQGSAVAVTALVDSGADLCTFRADLASTIGLDLMSGEEIKVGGSTGEGVGWLHKVRLVVDGATFNADALFVTSDTGACLGRIPLFCERQVSFCQKGEDPSLWWVEFSPY